MRFHIILILIGGILFSCENDSPNSVSEPSSSEVQVDSTIAAIDTSVEKTDSNYSDDYSGVDALKEDFLSYKSADTTKINKLIDYLFSKETKFNIGDSLLIRDNLKLSEQLGYSEGTITLYEMFARYLNQKSFYEASIKWGLRGDSLATAHNNQLLSLRLKSLVTEISLTQRDFNQALVKAREIIDIVKNTPTTVHHARHYFILGKCENAKKNYQNALQAFEKAKQICIEFNFLPGQAIADASIGDCYLSLHKYQEALSLLQKSFDVFQKDGRTTNTAGAHMTLSRCYLGLNKTDEALYHAKEALSIYHELGFNSYLKDSYLNLGKAYMQLGNLETSSTYIDSAFIVLDSINNLERINAIEALKTKYQTDQIASEKRLAEKDKQLAIVQKDDAESRAAYSNTISYISVIAVIIITILLWWAINRWRLSRRQKIKLDIAYKKLEEQKRLELAASNLKAIKSQMNPHFIFNSINSIQDSILQQDTLKSYDQLVVFSKLVRQVLDHSEQEFIPIAEEIEFLNTYLGIEKMRFSDDFTYTINTNLKSENLLIPSLIIQPFVENAIKHGLLHKQGEKRLSINIDQTSKNYIKCVIIDNGIGINASNNIHKSQKGHRSFSTNAIKERLTLLSDQTQLEAGFSYQNNTNENGEIEGTVVTIILPINVVS